ncbi:hypothetical protein ACV36C_38510, partial [Pseudomonas aeruginosa]
PRCVEAHIEKLTCRCADSRLYHEISFPERAAARITTSGKRRHIANHARDVLQRIPLDQAIRAHRERAVTPQESGPYGPG